MSLQFPPVWTTHNLEQQKWFIFNFSLFLNLKKKKKHPEFVIFFFFYFNYNFYLLKAIKNFPYPFRWNGGSVIIQATLFPSGDSFS